MDNRKHVFVYKEVRSVGTKQVPEDLDIQDRGKKYNNSNRYYVIINEEICDIEKISKDAFYQRKRRKKVHKYIYDEITGKYTEDENGNISLPYKSIEIHHRALKEKRYPKPPHLKYDDTPQFFSIKGQLSIDEQEKSNEDASSQEFETVKNTVNLGVSGKKLPTNNPKIVVSEISIFKTNFDYPSVKKIEQKDNPRLYYSEEEQKQDVKIWGKDFFNKNIIS